MVALSRTEQRNNGRNLEGAWRDGRNKTIQPLAFQGPGTSNTQQYMHLGRGGRAGEGVQDFGKEKHEKKNNEKERSAA